MDLLTLIYIPAGAALLALIVPRKWKYIRETIAVLGSLYFLKFAIQSFFINDQFLQIPWFEISGIDFSFDFRLYHFSRFILLFLGFFTLLTSLYSAGYFRDKKISHLYYPFILLTLSGAAALVLADNFFVLLLAWELVTLLLFYLIAMGQGKSAAMAAGKTFAILGFTDVALLLAVLALPILYGTWNISALTIQLNDPFSVTIFILMFIAAIAKAGAMPFHSWIPAATESAPLPVIAFLPASLDKLMGIYLLVRISMDVFVIPMNSSISLMIMTVGGVTIIAGVLVQVVQKEIKRLLAYCAITQVGYIILGIGTGNPVGIAGGIFHMLNHTIYKSCLFFSAGSIESKTGTTDMDRLGGLAKTMPVTFAACLIAALSVSGIPPFNGFVSKWMIYQSLVEGKSMIFMIFLIIAMFGSALTLASFLKLIYGSFLGQRYDAEKPVTDAPMKKLYNDVSWTMITPMVILALLCIGFGIFAFYPINTFIQPILSASMGEVASAISLGTALWDPTLATSLLLLGLIVGGIIFYISRIRVREVETLFVGGEQFEIEKERTVAGNFYEFMTRTKILGGFLRETDRGIFDIYNLSSDLGLVLVNVLKKMHDGILSTYLAWCIIGLSIISFILVVL